MRVSLSQSKGRGRRPCQEAPATGSRARKIYDYLFDHRGRVVDLREIESAFGVKRLGGNNLLDKLAMDYDLDIRCLGKGRQCLAGRWDGDTYLDFIASNQASYSVREIES